MQNRGLRNPAWSICHGLDVWHLEHQSVAIGVARPLLVDRDVGIRGHWMVEKTCWVVDRSQRSERSRVKGQGSRTRTRKVDKEYVIGGSSHNFKEAEYRRSKLMVSMLR
jgi:hypothetical protein